MMATMGTVMKAVMVGTPFFMMIYPVVVLIVLGRPHIVRAFERAENPSQSPL